MPSVPPKTRDLLPRFRLPLAIGLAAWLSLPGAGAEETAAATALAALQDERFAEIEAWQAHAASRADAALGRSPAAAVPEEFREREHQRALDAGTWALRLELARSRPVSPALGLHGNSAPADPGERRLLLAAIDAARFEASLLPASQQASFFARWSRDHAERLLPHAARPSDLPTAASLPAVALSAEMKLRWERLAALHPDSAPSSPPATRVSLPFPVSPESTTTP